MRLLSFLLLAPLLYGAELTGTWDATTKMPNGSRHESKFQLQETAGKLTGKITSKRGSVDIVDGTVQGNEISFTVVRVGNADELKIQFKGTVSGGTMKLRMEYRDHPPVEITAKRTT